MRALPLALAFVLLSAPSVRADDDAAVAARGAYQKGQTEYNLGNYAGAAKQFEEAYRFKPVSALLFNIAQCHRFLGNLEKAGQSYRAYLRNAPAGDKNIALASELLAQVETALASKKTAEQSPPHDLAPNPASPATQTPAQAPVVMQAPAQGVTPPGAPPAPPRPRGVYAYVAGGAAVVALGGGLYFGHKSSSAISDLQTGYHPTAEIDSTQASAKGDAGKATGLLVAAGVLAAAAGVLFALRF